MEHALLLNADYRPLAIVSFQRVVNLLLEEKVVRVSEKNIKTVRSPSTVFEIPSVIALKRYVNVPKRGIRWTKRGVLNRDDYRCGYCGITSGELRKREFTVDHILPASRGGKNSWSNTICSCSSCNQQKGDKTPHEAGMKLLWEPKTPRTNYVVVRLREEWKTYIEL